MQIRTDLVFYVYRSLKFYSNFFLIITCLLILNPAFTQKKDNILKIFMLWDMEGASGLFTNNHAWYYEKGVPKEIADEGRKLLTADVNSAARAALDAGADQLIICDTHHGGGNFIPEKLISDPRITWLLKPIGTENGKKRWMPGLDESVDGFMLMGHHAKAGTQGAFLHHTQMGEWADFIINGQSVGEMGLESCYAGHWNIPVVLAQGDEHACKEAEQEFPGIITAAVKHAESYDRATGIDAKAARKLTAEKVAEAVKKMRKGGTFKPFKPTLPMTVTIRMKTTRAAQWAAQKPGVRTVDAYTVEAQVTQQADVLKWITGAGLDMPEDK